MNDVVVQLDSVSKYYKLYSEPRDRLKEALNPFKKKYHKDYFALSEINLQVKRGEILGVVGKNGSGKSTLLKVISGVLKPSSGAVSVRGKISALLELGAGFNPEFTGLENIFFYGTILGLSKKEVDEKLDAIISFADIGEFINQPLKTYSSGMKSRLGFALATSVEPEILIVDEVLSVGDSAFQKKSLNKMESLVKSGAAVILVSHSESTITRFCDKAIYMRDGELLIKGKAIDVVKLYMKDSDSIERLSKESIQEELLYLEGRKDVNDSSSKNTQKVNNNAFYSSSIAKKSKPVVTKNYPIELKNVELLDSSGNKVNVIEIGGRYKLQCHYQFNQPVKNLVFPTTLYTSKSLCIYGVRHPEDNTTVDITRAQENLTVNFDFICTLMPGSYYFTVGVTQLTDGERHFLFRCDDALTFDILDSPGPVRWGFSIIESKVEHKFSNIGEL